MLQNKQELKCFLEPQQIASTQAGAAKLVISIRSMIEMNREWVVLKLDLTNAFNENARAAVIEVLESEQTLKHLAWFAATILAPYSGLETGGRRWGETGEGGTQGGPESAPFFCVAIQPAVRRMDEMCRAAGGMAKFGMDDGYAVGPKEVVIAAVKKFAAEVEEQCLLRLQWSKTEIFSWDGVLPAGCPAGISRAGEESIEGFRPGFLCYGVPVGTPEYASSQLWERARKISKDAKKTVDVLRGERQAIWAALKWSISQRFDYWCQLSYPSDLRPAAAWLDSELWKVLEAAVGTHIPREQEGRGWECVLPVPVNGREGRSFASWLVRLPIRLGGWGLRSLEENSLAAFVGAVEQAVPSFPGPEGICPQLSRYLGGEGSFQEDGGGEDRWQHMLEHGGRLGEEFHQSWGKLRLEAAESSRWLEEELEGPLAVMALNAGEESTSGATRRLVMEQLEQLRCKLLSKGLELYHNQEARPCWSWPDRGKQTTAWLLTLTGLTGPEFSEAAATQLCLPSPACASRLGEAIRGAKKIDMFGDNVRAAKLPGDGFRKRHDLVKNFIFRKLRAAGVPVECEVFNLFAREIPQEGLSRIERGRTRQTMVPDFKITVEEAGGRNEQRLYELKVISSCPTRYGRNPKPNARAVDRRADLLQNEYAKKARKADTKYGGTPEGETGRMERKLLNFGRVRGLVIGAWGEISEDLKNLMQIMADKKQEEIQAQTGGGEFESQ